MSAVQLLIALPLKYVELWILLKVKNELVTVLSGAPKDFCETNAADVGAIHFALSKGIGALCMLMPWFFFSFVFFKPYLPNNLNLQLPYVSSNNL